MAEQRTVKLVSADNEVFEVERGVATMSQMVKNCLDDTAEEDQRIPLLNVEAKTLAKVIEYCRYHHQLKSKSQQDNEVERWDSQFIQVDQSTLFHIILAANYLDIHDLIELACKTVAEMIRGKKPEQIRAEFNITNDFTPEEEDAVKRENQWCEEQAN